MRVGILDSGLMGGKLEAFFLMVGRSCCFAKAARQRRPTGNNLRPSASIRGKK